MLCLCWHLTWQSHPSWINWPSIWLDRLVISTKGSVGEACSGLFKRNLFWELLLSSCLTETSPISLWTRIVCMQPLLLSVHVVCIFLTESLWLFYRCVIYYFVCGGTHGFQRIDISSLFFFFWPYRFSPTSLCISIPLTPILQSSP